MDGSVCRMNSTDHDTCYARQVIDSPGMDLSAVNSTIIMLDLVLFVDGRGCTLFSFCLRRVVA